MQHAAPQEYLTLAEAAGWARISRQRILEAVLIGDLRSVANSLIRVRDLERWARACRAVNGSRRAPELGNDRVQFAADTKQAV